MAKQAGHRLPLGDPHAGPFTAGSEDTTLWSSLRKNKNIEIWVNLKTDRNVFREINYISWWTELKIQQQSVHDLLRFS